ncbi:hypothetical protein SAMN04487818_113144 [Actinokineospora terrae]|uniref:NPCBM/NEW2 domain-containing protein n=1 Tax=Actinokineospora terrae TaxID=155974 RepID=A0A1H9X8T0_9PSEU|nr:hypothetical protein SAMN04487818_113144 [Actinokineospora terrae]
MDRPSGAIRSRFAASATILTITADVIAVVAVISQAFDVKGWPVIGITFGFVGVVIGAGYLLATSLVGWSNWPRLTVAMATMAGVVLVVIGVVGASGVTTTQAGPGPSASAAPSAATSTATSTTSHPSTTTAVSPTTSVVSRTTVTSTATPNTREAVYVKELVSEQEQELSHHGWVLVDISGTPIEGEAAYVSPCQTDSIKKIHFVVPEGYRYFVSQVGASKSSPPGTKIRFEVYLDGGIRPVGSVDASLTQPQSLRVALDPAKIVEVELRATLVNPPPDYCRGGSARAMWGEARVEA